MGAVLVARSEHHVCILLAMRAACVRVSIRGCDSDAWQLPARVADFRVVTAVWVVLCHA
jgi:hypothetical protein